MVNEEWGQGLQVMNSEKSVMQPAKQAPLVTRLDEGQE